MKITVDELTEFMEDLRSEINNPELASDKKEALCKVYVEVAKTRAELEEEKKNKRAVAWDIGLRVAGLVLEAVAIIGAIFVEREGSIISKLWSKLRFKNI